MVILVAFMALLIVPIFYLVIQATNYLGVLWPIIYLVTVLVVHYIIDKTGFKKALPAQSQKTTQILFKMHRIRIAVASGLFTAFAVVFAARLIIGPLSTYFLIPFIILTVVGALIGDSIWKLCKRKKWKDETK
jgi:predicted neutral ceramidase superfamily lipid hydrolase